MPQQISTVIITFNEEKNIRRCLESVLNVSDEIIVVDSFSTDRTESICKEYNVRFMKHDFVGHIEQKNWAKSQAKYDCILSLDADEALDNLLVDEIKKVKETWIADGYTMNRLTNYCGKWIRHTAWYPDVKLRLFDRRKGKWGGMNPHDEFIMNTDSTTKHLSGDILHYSFYTVGEHLKQINKFSTIGAKALYKRGNRSNRLLLLIKPTARFIKNYIVRRGYLDGKEGLTISRLSAYANYLKYKKLLQLQKNKEIE